MRATVARYVFGSIRRSVRGASATQTASAPSATAVGAGPELIVRTTTSSAGSMRESVSSSELSTHTACESTATDVGVAPTAIAFVTRSDAGLITATEFDGAMMEPPEPPRVSSNPPATAPPPAASLQA
jgi:hypothetical protein